MTANQTDHRSEAERRLGGPGARWTPTENLLAAIHDGQQEQTEWLHRIRDLLSITYDLHAERTPKPSTAHDCGTDGHIWHTALDGTVEVCCECGTARKSTPEPDTVTVTLPRDVVTRLIKSADEVAGTYRRAGNVVDAGLREGAASALESAYHDALDAANRSQS